MLYHAYELTHAAIGPMRQAARFSRQALRSPFNPFAGTISARATAAACEMFVSATKRYGKPEFGIETVEVGGTSMVVVEENVVSKPFCNLKHFRRIGAEQRDDPKVLIVAPMSGHYATLLRGTVEAMLPEHEVYITDWVDARDVPLSEGSFDLSDYADYVMEFCQELAVDGERPAVMAVCQPGVPCLAAASLMAEEDDPARPSALILMGSPIDTRVNMTEPCKLAASKPLSWFEKNVVVMVPWPNQGFLRRVYPGFLQLSGFMSMNMDRHMDAHVEQYQNLVRGDGDSIDAHNKFYDEYMAVMDLTAEFYLQTVERVFQKHHFPLGVYKHHDRVVDPKKITDIGLMTIEGEKDDITGRGQTEAAQGLCLNIPSEARINYVQEEVGHYGVFNGSRFRKHIQPKIRNFIRARREAAAGGPAVVSVEEVVANGVAAISKARSPGALAKKSVAKAAPAKTVPTQVAPVKAQPTKARSAKTGSVKATSARAPSTKAIAAKDGSAKAASGEAAMSKAASAKVAPAPAKTAANDATKTAPATPARQDPASKASAKKRSAPKSAPARSAALKTTPQKSVSKGTSQSKTAGSTPSNPKEIAATAQKTAAKANGSGALKAEPKPANRQVKQTG